MGLVISNLHSDWILHHIASSAFVTDSFAKTNTDRHEVSCFTLFAVMRFDKRKTRYFHLKTRADIGCYDAYFALYNDNTNFAMSQLPLRTTNLDLTLCHVTCGVLVIRKK